MIHKGEKNEKVLMTHRTKLFNDEDDEENDDVFITRGNQVPRMENFKYTIFFEVYVSLKTDTYEIGKKEKVSMMHHMKFFNVVIKIIIVIIKVYK